MITQYKQQKKPNKVSNVSKSKKRFHYVKKNGAFQRKRKFDTKEKADAFIKKHRLVRKGYKSYFCPYCLGWHIGHAHSEGETKSIKS